ncbi:MAG TPA: polysaccharide deacetylase family protein [Prolixibacteraceae bacterium]|nr:polysaccharide deacetylase family protein [Prolixibacteraceae bacterium]
MRNRINYKVRLPEWLTRLFPQAIWRMPQGDNTLYLTFDDGPVPEVTPQVLDILKLKNIKATFFCVGDNVKKYPELYKRIIDEGHSVGNHTHNHLQGPKYKTENYLNNISLAQSYISSNMFRPPHGVLTRAQYNAISASFYIVMWDVISCDYDKSLSPQQCINNVLDFVRDGSIITFHDSIKAQKNVLTALPFVIDNLFNQGYNFNKIELPKKIPFDGINDEKTDKLRNNINRLLKGAS